MLAEFLWLTKQGKVTWERFFDFIDRLEATGGFRVAALDLDTFSRMTYIVMASPPPRPELELHDLSILATALLVDGKLITQDRKLRQQTLVDTLW